VTPFGSPPSLTYNQLLGDGFAAFNAPLTSTFDFTPATSPPDGKIVSQVYFNAGAGLYAYLYQVQVSPSAVIGVSNTVHDVNFNFQNGTFATHIIAPAGTASFGVGNDYAIDSNGAGPGTVPGAFSLNNLIGTGSSQGTDHDRYSIQFPTGQSPTGILNDGHNSDIMVVFTTRSPTVLPIVSADDSGSTLLNFPLTYAPSNPVPEPASVVVMGLGGLGLLAGYRRRQRQQVTLS